MKKVNVLLNSPEKVGKFIQILQKCAQLSIHADDAEAGKIIQNIQDYVVE